MALCGKNLPKRFEIELTISTLGNEEKEGKKWSLTPMKTNGCVEKDKIIIDYMAQLWIAFHSYNNINVEYSWKQNYIWGEWGGLGERR